MLTNTSAGQLYLIDGNGNHQLLGSAGSISWTTTTTTTSGTPCTPQTVSNPGPVQGQFRFDINKVDMDAWAKAMGVDQKKKPTEDTLAELDAILADNGD